ncbi:chemotaxis-specific protein-glutamate methyltransferase CheB [Marinoscillum furvescens]|uniref:Protein-glutamate methylesterase/protein-glutamine glutaminase n=1 Tax=Marinoscillum furvescens DSM 4134 TaxID=1122208 RepID=A0A3D9L4U7_MARFU|nr:chemotaxis-specific protein-glutamate methyltransferase CheB [Marinoscillum furvescens]REE01002.1 two-component system chemotaxis response regulator CheB [Marinoscillum furvescens DSM 4134]
MAKKISILVVDDSAFLRLLINDLLSKEEDLEVVGTATDGREAVKQTLALKPDIVLLDMNMGDYDGMFAVEQIMEKLPTPILILSSVGNTNLHQIFDALELGAVDYINKPVKGGSKLREITTELVAAVKRVAKARPRTTPVNRDGLNELHHTFDDSPNYDVIVIGASTGGPTAVEKVLLSLPANLNVPLVIGQHMPPNFILSFAARLDHMSPLRIVVGRPGMEPKPGMVIIAPGDGNMILEKRDQQVLVGFSDRDYPEYNHPSINALMYSVAEIYGPKALGVLLTGMGKDGVKGLKMIRNKGGKTIAQDEESSVIYGMPKLAYETGAAEVVMHVKEIGGYLVNCL